MEKKPKMRSFAKRLTRWIAIMQFIVMGFATYWIYSFIKGFGEMEETDLYRSYLTNSNANISRILSNVYLGTLNHVKEIEDNLGQPDRMPSIMKDIVSRSPYIRSCDR